ncbi:MAG: Rep family protein, partial [Lactobacillus sp.]|nr:Rep family protein [Lactobacillus sp.]
MQDKNHLKVKESELSKILGKSGALEWAYINHNKDVDNRGQPIRAHYHVILKYENPLTIDSVASLFQDNPQYVQVWRGRINNAYSYLIHETEDADSEGKYHYPDSDVIASFDFPARMEKIRKKIKLSPKYEKEQIRRYSEQQITREQLTEELGVYGVASHQQLIDRIDSELANQAHEQWLRDFKGHKMTTLWLYGESGVGKTRLAEHIFRNEDYVTLGSSRDHFQEYQGEHFIIIN